MTNSAEALRAQVRAWMDALPPTSDYRYARMAYQQVLAWIAENAALASQPKAAGAGGDAVATELRVIQFQTFAMDASRGESPFTRNIRAAVERANAAIVATPAPAVSVDEAMCVAIYDAVSRANLTRDVKSPDRKCAVVRAALNPTQDAAHGGRDDG